mmetsp:Transcript_9112/g.9888  ORF Transcript_9112/g.9888 Transcript_9112/m.9888 type:complete len:302 (+) Transcript_9112:289-1194(+)
MPIPICASRIMETSLAPSPTAMVTSFMLCLTNRTTRAFCRGVTRQQITASHSRAISRKSVCSLASFKIISSGSPSMMIPCFADFPDLISISFNCSRILLGATSDILIKDMLGVIKLQFFPTFSAVSNLSPVKTQTLIPAVWKSSRHSGTSSCSLSSTEVAPNKNNSLSICSATAAILSSRFSTDSAAALKPSLHLWYSSSSRIRIEILKVLIPLRAKANRAFSVSSMNGWSICLSNNDLTIESAPLQYNLMSPSVGSLTITVIRLRSLLNSSIFKKSNSISSLLILRTSLRLAFLTNSTPR